MANDLNRCEFIGRLGADPESKTFQNGDQVARFRIAVGSSWKDKQTGEKRESTEWVSVSCFGGLAKVVMDYLKKGSRVYIAGRFRTREYEDKEGIKRYSTEIVLDMNGTMQMLDPPPTKGERPAPASEPRKAAPTQVANQVPFDDEIPF